MTILYSILSLMAVLVLLAIIKVAYWNYTHPEEVAAAIKSIEDEQNNTKEDYREN